jgi:hypothetical protein
MDSYLKAQLAVLALFVAMIATAGCIRLISAEQLEDGSAVMCFRAEPTPTADAGPGAAPTIAPAMRYGLVHAPVGTVTPAAPRSP